MMQISVIFSDKVSSYETRANEIFSQLWEKEVEIEF